MTERGERFKLDRHTSGENDDAEQQRRGRTTTQDVRPDAEGRGTNFGAVEIADEQVGNEGASNYRSSAPKASREVDHNDGHEKDDDGRGQGMQTYESGEAASASIDEEVED